MKKFVFTLLMLLALVLPTRIDAAICNQNALEKAKNDAYKLKFSYEIKTRYDEETTSDVFYYEITVTNLTKEIVVVGDEYYTYGSNPDNPATAVFAMNYEGNATVFKPRVKASLLNDCAGETVYAPTINLPAYNIYYNTEECLKYPEFKYCDKDYSGEMPSQDEFDNALDQYIEENEGNEEEPKPNEEKEKSIFDTVIDFIKEHKVLSISTAVIVSGGIITISVIKIRRRKKRVKINLEV